MRGSIQVLIYFIMTIVLMKYYPLTQIVRVDPGASSFAPARLENAHAWVQWAV